MVMREGERRTGIPRHPRGWGTMKASLNRWSFKEISSTYCIENSVNVECWVDDQSSVEDVVPDIATGIKLDRTPRKW